MELVLRLEKVHNDKVSVNRIVFRKLVLQFVCQQDQKL